MHLAGELDKFAAERAQQGCAPEYWAPPESDELPGERQVWEGG